MNAKKTYKYFLYGMIIILASCNSVKNVPEGKYLLDKNHITTDNSKINISKLKPYIKQNPNRKILGFRFYLHIHNWANNGKVEEKELAKMAKTRAKNEKREIKNEQKNKKREAKGKEPKDVKLKKYKPTKRKWLMETVGEYPEIVDSLKIEKSKKQLKNYLFKKGYFETEITDSIVGDSIKKKAKVFYIIKAKPAYKINSISYSIPDPRISKYLSYRKDKREMKVGENFDMEKLQVEREKIVSYLLDRGYHYFTQDYIQFDVDTALKTRSVNIDLIINDFQSKDEKSGELIIQKHNRYQINKIYIYTEYDIHKGDDMDFYDSLTYNGYTFLFNQKLRYKPTALLQKIFVYSKQMYKHEDVLNTFRRLSGLGVFNSVRIDFKKSIEPGNFIDCFIKLVPLKRNSISIETNGTNKNGTLGLNARIAFINKNTFKGTEELKLGVSGSVEAQRFISDEEAGRSTNFTNNFNIFEFGPSITLTVPKFLLPVSQDKFAKNLRPRTILTASLNYQQRPDFTRNFQRYSIQYRWNQTNKISHTIAPLEVNYIDVVEIDTTFLDAVVSSGNLIYINSFRDQFIWDGRYTYTYTDNNTAKKLRFYYRGSAETAGNFLRFLSNITGQEKIEGTNSFEAAGIPFAQYFRTNHTYTINKKLNSKSNGVMRFAGGFGFPYLNSNELVIDKSFFVGGVNALRAWRTAVLGPGTSKNPLQTLSRYAEIRLETNYEYRFDLIDFIKGAVFADFGNVWLFENDSDSLKQGQKNQLEEDGYTTEEANFLVDNEGEKGISSEFLSQFGIGVGVGIRFDIKFFVLRFDLGVQFYDPTLDGGERWVWQPKDEYNAYLDVFNSIRPEEDQVRDYKTRLLLNFGIGYPF